MEQMPPPEQPGKASAEGDARWPEPSNPVTADTPIGTHHSIKTAIPFDPENPFEITVGSEWLYDLRFAVVEGRLECVGLKLEHSTLGKPITTMLLRSLQIGSQIQRWRQQTIQASETVLEIADLMEYSDDLREEMRRTLGVATRKKHRYSPEHFQLVAEIYDRAHRTGQPPTKAVQEHFSDIYGQSFSRSAAAKWVMTCRKMGLLPPTSPRKAASNPPGENE
jgi:hypothetical protein